MIAIHPITIIELMIAMAILIVCFCVSFLLKHRWRKIGLSMAGVLMFATVAFFLLRPHWIDGQISKRSEMLADYLTAAYPDSRWEITSIDHRTYRQYNPYHLIVTFTDEPQHEYTYRVDRHGEVQQISVAVPDHTSLKELKYVEMEMGE